MSRSSLLILCWLISGVSFAQSGVLVEELPKDLSVERIMQIAQSALASRGWFVTNKQVSTIDAEDRTSKIRLSVMDGAIRYTDLAHAPPEFWQRHVYEGTQQILEPVSAQRLADLRTHLNAALGNDAQPGRSAATATPGIILMGNLPTNLTNQQILRAVWSALSGRRWVVLPSSGDTVIAEYNSADTAGKIKLFIVGRDLRYTDEGTRQRSSGGATTLPDNWLANLRADTAKRLQDLTNVQAANPPAINSAPESARTPAERLRTLKELHDSGAITRDEYDKKRAEILKDL